LKIAIVEDEIRIREGIVNLLKKLYPEIETVYQARSGEDGLAVILENQPEIVITDIRMEPMNGLEMLNTLIMRNKMRFKTIILSAYSEFDYAKQAISLGVCEYLLKPIDLEEFRAVMERVINDLQTGSPAGPPAPPDTPEGIIVRKAKRIVEEYYHQGITLWELADKMHVTPEHVSAQFVKELGMNFSMYIRTFRMQKAKELLINTDLKLYQIAEMIGYSSARYFGRVFKETEGMLPSEYRNNNR